MNQDTVIKVENVSKKYCKSLKRSMLYGMADIGRNILGLSSHPEKLRKNEFWAVDDVSFELKKGETLGIIGPNGSGKTTLLKMLNGIFWPDKGKITVRGRVGALIEVGAGFHPLLTGRENIYMTGSIMGMSRRVLNQKFNDIVSFADIGDFIDTPVKYYSSGMYVRLGFSVAIHSDPDILLIDEILAVGDAGFRAKCYNKIAEIKNNTAIVFVTHNMTILHRVVDKCMVLKNGGLYFEGDATNSVMTYQDLFSDSGEHNIKIENQSVEIMSVTINGIEGREKIRIKFGDQLNIKIRLRSQMVIKNFILNLVLRNIEEIIVAECNSKTVKKLFNMSNGDMVDIEINIPHVTLNPGFYLLAALIMSEDMLTHYYWNRNILKIEIYGENTGSSVYQILSDWSFKKISRPIEKKPFIKGIEKNIFLVGHARGGSTALAGIVNWHSMVEPKYFDKTKYNSINHFLKNILSNRFHLDFSSKLEQKEIWFSRFPGKEVFTHMGKELIIEELDWEMEDIIKFKNKIKMDLSKSSNVFLSKTPSNSFRIKVIPEIFPNSKIIAVYRRGEEVVASWGQRPYGFGMKVNWGKVRFRKLGFKKGIDIFARKWMETLSYLEECRREMNFLAITYDNLIDNTHDTLKIIFEYLELPIEEYIYEVKLVDSRNKWMRTIPKKYHNYLENKTIAGNTLIESVSAENKKKFGNKNNHL